MVRIPAGKFKDQCLKLLDRVAQTRDSIVVTKRGRPVAAVVPYSPPRKASDSLKGSVLEEHGDPYGTGEAWDADSA